MMEIIIIFITGLFIGLLSSVCGIGGAMIWLPILYKLFPETPTVVILSTTLTFIMLNALKNSYIFARENISMPYKTLAIMSLLMGLCAVCFKIAFISLDEKILQDLYIYFISLFTLKEYCFKEKVEGKMKKEKTFKKINLLRAFPIFGLSGILSGATGLGGGILLAPLSISFLKVPIVLISPFINFCIFISTLSIVIKSLLTEIEEDLFLLEFLTPTQIGEVNLGLTFLLFLSSLPTSFLGIKYAKKIDAKQSKKIFKLLLLSISLKLWFDKGLFFNV